jgi:hypothetical protein
LAIVSTEQEESTKTIGGQDLTREMFPHQSATIALQECGARIVTTDGSYESQAGEGGREPRKARSSRGQVRDPDLAHPGSVVIVVPPGGKPRWTKLSDDRSDDPDPPAEV